MPELWKVKERIRALANRSRNVTLAEIEQVLGQLSQHGYVVTSRMGTHGKLFNVNGQRFMVCCHNPGSKQVKACYVREFLKAMIELELYE